LRAEATLAVRYRDVSPDGRVSGVFCYERESGRFFVIEAPSVVPGLPVQLALRRFAAVGCTAAHDPEEARALFRALLAQAVSFHSPSNLRLVVCARDIEGPQWGWAKWLPHTHHPEERDNAGPVRMMHSSLAVLEEWLGAELTRRTRFNRNAEPDPELPHLLVVVDGGLVMGTEALLDPGGMQAVTVLDVSGHAAALTAAHGVALEVAEDGTLAVRAGESTDELGVADTLSVPETAALAEQLAHFRPEVATTVGDVEDLATADNTLPALLGIADPGRLDLDTQWRDKPMRDRLRVPIGVSADGGLLELDIKESAQNGMGPHGLVVGATGSGKSELLRTLVLGMAATHSSEQLNLVLVDFKGGATFAGMSELPHVAAVITNLEDNLSLVDRMKEALSGEMNRRQEALRDAGWPVWDCSRWRSGVSRCAAGSPERRSAE
jgi:S-DNA-T family DNA segregation ATPase FtsK/SpoIIIE